MHTLSPDGGGRGRVLVLVPRWTHASQRETQGLPFRTITLASAFLHAGYEVVFFDQEQDQDRTDRTAELLRHVAGAAAAFVWMNEMYPYHQCVNTWQLATRLKQARPDLPVVAGGEFITLCPPGFFDVEAPVDWFLRGYGEKSGLQLLECLAQRRSVAAVPGLVWREGGSLRHNPPDGRPDFAPEYLALYGRIDLAPYVQTGGIFGNDQPTLTIGTGRGCVKGCAFCCWRAHPSRILDAEHVVGLIRDLRARYGVRQYHIGELDFFTSKARVSKVAQLMREQAPDCIWFALASPCDLMQLGETDWDLLAAGGLRKVELGSESGSARLLRDLGKRHGPEDVFRASRSMIERGIVPMNNLLFGFPGETAADRRETLALIHRLWQLSNERNCMTFRYYQACWGTPTGAVALAAVPDAPRTVVEFLQQRHQFTEESFRAIPWLPQADELEIKRLVNHYLPLLTSRLELRPAWRQHVYRSLRGVAERRVATHRLGRTWDRWLYDHLIGQPLDCTYTP